MVVIPLLSTTDLDSGELRFLVVKVNSLLSKKIFAR